MENFINHLEINNFKSIKKLKLDSKRVNVFIGKPNVGKSNILEAISILNPQNFVSKALEHLGIRLEGFNELHYDNDQTNNIRIEMAMDTDCHYKLDLFKLVKDSSEITKGVYLTYQQIKDLQRKYTDIPGEWDIIQSFWHYLLKEDGFEYIANGYPGTVSSKQNSENLFAIKKYEFRDSYSFDVGAMDDEIHLFIRNNLFDVVSRLDSLKQKIVEIFKNDYGLQFVFSKVDKKFFVQKFVDGYVYQYPYSSVADTFQRFIFYLAAIESNSNAVLIFEEPEVHSFPPYVKELAERIVSKKDNQYFISTHSPYMLQTLVEELDDSELNVILTYYKDYQTHVKILTPEELKEVQDFSINLFFNLTKFEPNA